MCDHDIFTDENDSNGYLFVFSSGKLGKPHDIRNSELHWLSTTKYNENGIVVLCKKCNTYMDFFDRDIGFHGYFKCSICGSKVMERTAYKKLEKIGIAFVEEYRDVYGNDAAVKIPDICMDCDGPYPKCKTSCKFFTKD